MSETLHEHWTYNCEDTVRTLECAHVERGIIKSFSLEGPEAAQQAMFLPVLHAMLRGVRINTKARSEMAGTLMEEMSKREQFFLDILGHPLNPASTKQMQGLFYTDLKLPIQIKRGTGRPTLDDDALSKISLREPIIRPLIRAIQEYRSLGVFLGTFVNAPLDEDQRMRCSYNICGTESLRLASSKNAFGSGTNLQNIPKGTKAREVDDLSLPNIRTLFIPDEGMTFFDGDLDRADLQVVVWEADDKDLKLALHLGVDMHLMNACSIFSIKGIDYHELIETHPNYPEHRGRIGEAKRQIAKTGVHAVDYGCKARTLAIHLGSTVAEADRFITGWFNAHPGIKKWHTSVESMLNRQRYVVNKFGYRRFYFERTEGILPEALAWIPQSTVALTINRIWQNIFKNVPGAEVLLQVHDSLAGQFPTNRAPEIIQAIQEASKIVIPYDDPLIIPFGLKTSTQSWGHCK